jgi:hypothetical protein
MDPVPDPLLRKSGSAGNRTRDLWICSQEIRPLDYGGGLIILNKKVKTGPWMMSKASITLYTTVTKFMTLPKFEVRSYLIRTSSKFEPGEVKIPILNYSKYNCSTLQLPYQTAPRFAQSSTTDSENESDIQKIIHPDSLNNSDF